VDLPDPIVPKKNFNSAIARIVERSAWRSIQTRSAMTSDHSHLETEEELNDGRPPPKPKRGLAGMLGRPIWLEARSPVELRTLKRSRVWRGVGIPEGNDRPVLIIPGFLAGRKTANALHHVLTTAGWDAVIAPVGRNAGPAQFSIDAAEGALTELYERTGQPIRIIGHSRGGQFGRIIAVRHPGKVCQVVAVGTPLTVKYPTYLVVRLPAEALDRAWRLGAFGHVDIAKEREIDDLRYVEFPDHIDLVSVWSKSDGIVDWRLSFEDAATSVEVKASHLGLINSIAGMRGIAAALARVD